MDLSLTFDLPTQTGYDSDHELAEEVGKAGAAIDSIEDMQDLLKGARLEEVSTSMTINATGYILLAFYAVLARQQGADLKKITGVIQMDNLKGHTGRGAYIYPVRHSMRIITDMYEWYSREIPKWNMISVSVDPIRESGRPAVVGTDDSIRSIHLDKLVSLRRRRDPARCDSILQDLNDKASSGENIMPVVVEAAEHFCTLGEIADTLREVFGEYKRSE